MSPEVTTREATPAAGTTHGLGSPDEAQAHDQFRREYLGPNF